MLVDGHVHTKYSFDSSIEPKTLLKVAKKKGINTLIITDHGTIKGGVLTKKAKMIVLQKLQLLSVQKFILIQWIYYAIILTKK